ncbi:MAG: helix-turn-helix domain-containing protein [Pseudomonadota bacterium]
METEGTVTVTEAAKILGVSRTLVYRALASGDLHREPMRGYKRGGPSRIPRKEVEELRRKWRESEGA